MASSKKAYYILVFTSTEAMAVNSYLRKSGCKARIAPIPRGATSCCGACVMVDPSDIEEVKSLLSSNEAPNYDRIIERENTIDPTRDVFC